MPSGYIRLQPALLLGTEPGTLLRSKRRPLGFIPQLAFQTGLLLGTGSPSLTRLAVEGHALPGKRRTTKYLAFLRGYAQSSPLLHVFSCFDSKPQTTESTEHIASYPRSLRSESTAIHPSIILTALHFSRASTHRIHPYMHTPVCLLGLLARRKGEPVQEIFCSIFSRQAHPCHFCPAPSQQACHKGLGP